MSPYLLYLLVFTISTIGAVIQAASGFGYGIFVMSVLPFLVPYGDALCSTGLVAIFTSSAIAARYRRFIDYRVVLVPVLANFVFSAAGTYFLKNQADDFMKRILGAVLIALSLYMFFLSDRVKVRASTTSGVVAGGLGGILGSVFGMGGPPIVVYLLSATTVTESYLANMQLYFFVTNIYTSGVRALSGLMNMNALTYAACGCLGVVIGARMGNAVFRRLDIRSLRRMVYAFMIVTGLALLLRG